MVVVSPVELVPPPVPIEIPKAPEMPTGASGSFVPNEQPEAILGIMNEHNGEPPRQILEAVADAKLPDAKKPSAVESASPIPEPAPETDDSKKTPNEETAKPDDTKKEEKTEAKPTTAEEKTEDQAKDAKKKEQPEDEAEKLVRREDVKQQLRALGVLLLENKDTRASLVAISLSAGDTPMGDEFREGTLRLILTGRKIEQIEQSDWDTMQNTLPDMQPLKNSNLGKFLAKHGFGEENLQNIERSLAENVNEILNDKDKKKHLSPLAEDLRYGLGFDKNHPVPTSAQDLALQYGQEDTETKTHLMKEIHRKEVYEERKSALKDQLLKMKGSAPNYLYFGLIGMSFLTQMVREADGQGKG